MGCFPQTTVPFPALRDAALSIGRCCYQKNIVGHVGVDFVSYVDSNKQLRLWAVDLNLKLTHSAASFAFFDFLVQGCMDADTGLYSTAEGKQSFYVSVEMLHHPNLSSIHHSAFFNLCRLKGVSFDLQ